MRDFLEYFPLWILKKIIELLPFKSVGHIGNFFGTFVYYCIPIRKKLTLQNLANAFPEKDFSEINTLALATYKNLFISLLEIFWFSRLTKKNIHEIVTLENTEKISQLLKKEKGLIVLSAHFGNWELGALALGLEIQEGILVIVQQQRNMYVDRLMNNFRTMFNNTTVTLGKAPREIIRAIQNNKVIALLADQSGGEDGLFVEYFNRPVSTRSGPAIFSVRNGTPIIAAFMVRQPNGTYIATLEEINTENLNGTTEEKVRELTQRHVAVLENYVRKYPEQWLWLHKRWKHSDKK